MVREREPTHSSWSTRARCRAWRPAGGAVDGGRGCLSGDACLVFLVEWRLRLFPGLAGGVQDGVSSYQQRDPPLLGSCF
jgi:hypothetical protein